MAASRSTIARRASTCMPCAFASAIHAPSVHESQYDVNTTISCRSKSHADATLIDADGDQHVQHADATAQCEQQRIDE